MICPKGFSCCHVHAIPSYTLHPCNPLGLLCAPRCSQYDHPFIPLSKGICSSQIVCNCKLKERVSYINPKSITFFNNLHGQEEQEKL